MFKILFHSVLTQSELNNYEQALIQYKKIDIKNSIEDMFALAKVFFKLGKYQQCFKSTSFVLLVVTFVI